MVSRIFRFQGNLLRLPQTNARFLKQIGQLCESHKVGPPKHHQTVVILLTHSRCVLCMCHDRTFSMSHQTHISLKIQVPKCSRNPVLRLSFHFLSKESYDVLHDAQETILQSYWKRKKLWGIWIEYHIVRRVPVVNIAPYLEGKILVNTV